MEETNTYQQIWKLLDEAESNHHFLEHLTHLSWILLLKYFSDYNVAMEREDQQDNSYYAPMLIEENYRWSNWVPKLLNQFYGSDKTEISSKIIDDLFIISLRYQLSLLEIFFASKKDSIMHQTLSSIFKLVLSCIDSSPHPLRTFLSLVNDLNLYEQKTRETIASMYEKLLQNLQRDDISARDFFTPPALANFMLNIYKPQAPQKVYDPACGTGAFLLATHQYLYETQASSSTRAPKNFLYGNALDDMSALLSATNTALRIQPLPQLYHNKTSLDPLSPAIQGGFSLIVSNPPFSRFKNEKTENGHTFSQTGNNEPIFLKHSINNLMRGGLAAIIVSDTALTKTTRDFIKMRQTLLQQCQLTMVVYLPYNTFQVKVYTAVLFFKKIREIQTSSHFSKEPYATDTILYLSPARETHALDLYLRAVSQAWENYQNGKTIPIDPAIDHWIEQFDKDKFQQKKFCLENRFTPLKYEPPLPPLTLLEHILAKQERFAVLADNIQFPLAFSTALLENCQKFHQSIAHIYHEITSQKGK